jgi:nucleoside phosphorylase
MLTLEKGSFLFVAFEMESHVVAQVGLKLAILCLSLLNPEIIGVCYQLG